MGHQTDIENLHLRCGAYVSETLKVLLCKFVCWEKGNFSEVKITVQSQLIVHFTKYSVAAKEEGLQ